MHDDDPARDCFEIVEISKSNDSTTTIETE